MSTPEAAPQPRRPAMSRKTGVEAIVHAIPIVLPVMGGVLIFLLAFIAVYMA